MGTCTSSNATAPSTKSPVKRGSIKNECKTISFSDPSTSDPSHTNYFKTIIADNQQSRIPNDRNSGGRRAGALAPPGFVDISKSRIKDLGQLQIGMNFDTL